MIITNAARPPRSIPTIRGSRARGRTIKKHNPRLSVRTTIVIGEDTRIHQTPWKSTNWSATRMMNSIREPMETLKPERMSGFRS